MGRHAVTRSAVRDVKSVGATAVQHPNETSHRLLVEMAQLFGSHFDVSLPVSELPAISDESFVKKGKEFSVGLLENRVDHPWSSHLRSVSSFDRMTVAGSLFLWRKTLPSGVASAQEHRDRVTAPEIALPPGYVSHIVRTVEEFFPVGWDHDYLSFVHGATPTVNSVVEASRGKGGWRSMAPDRESHAIACMGDSEFVSSDHDLTVKYMTAQCAGKSRSVTVMSASAQPLKPLHKLIYAQISKSPWLLRGEAKPAVFRKFLRRPGEVLVSGDYDSASDHLPVTSAEWVLRAIARRSRHVPQSVWAQALRYLRVRIDYGSDGVFESTRQLMGSLLCFPLLCIQNYVAFRWVFPASVPVKINGDDIVFRSTQEGYEKWAAFVGTVGLKLSPGKTMVHPSFFSLNSTFFRASKTRVRLVPVIRCSSLLPGKSPYPCSVAGSYVRFLKGFRGELRKRLAVWFLRSKKRVIEKSGRSCVSELGIPTDMGALKGAGLWTRELWYVNTVPKRAVHGEVVSGLPLPVPPDRLAGQVPLPEGWRRLPLPRKKKEARLAVEAERDFFDELIDRTWSTPVRPVRVVESEYWSLVSSGGYESSWVRWASRARRLPRFLRSFRRRSKLPARTFFRNGIQMKTGKRVWMQVEEEKDEQSCRTKEEQERVLALCRMSNRPPKELTIGTNEKLLARELRAWLHWEILADCFVQ